MSVGSLLPSHLFLAILCQGKACLYGLRYTLPLLVKSGHDKAVLQFIDVEKQVLVVKIAML